MNLTNEYIRGLVEGEGTFTFHSSVYITSSGKKKIYKIPAFSIQMHERDENLLIAMRDNLKLKHKVHNLASPALVVGYPNNHKIYKRGRKCILSVRDMGSLKNIIIPFFYRKLKGNKGIQFNEWLNKIGEDPNVSDHYKLLYRLYKSGYFDN